MPGFRGDICEINIDECSDNPCQNNGTCVELVNGFACECPGGFEGDTCEINVDECSENPCQNNATCVDGINGFACECPAGFQGDTCEINIDECSENPCQNNGACVDGIDEFTCECAPGFRGETCDIDVDDCEDSPCRNGASCVDVVDGFTCECAPGFRGETCDINIDDCDIGSCLNGGRCIDGIQSFRCECPPGVWGNRCEIDLTGCDESPCRNDGECNVTVGGFTCECLPGFRGDTCQENIDECSGDPCENGGTCTDGINAFTCECPPGFQGDTCQGDVNECAVENGGCAQRCINVPGSFACACEPGFELDANTTDCRACEAGTVAPEGSQACTTCDADTFDNGSEECASCPNGFWAAPGATGCQVAPVDGYTHPQDYGFLYWPTNHWIQWGQFLDVQHVQTGFYGLAIDVSTADITNLGVLEEQLSAEDALHDSSTRITALPNASVSYSVVQGDSVRLATAFFGENGSTSNRSRLIDMGRFMQRVDIPEIQYTDTIDLLGSMELAAMTRHFALTHRVQSESGGNPLQVQMRIAGSAVAQFPETQWRAEGRALSITNSEGMGWTFIIPEYDEATPIIDRDTDGSILFANAYDTSAPGEVRRLTVIGVPSNAGGENQLAVWLSPKDILHVEYAQKNRDGSVSQTLRNAAWDPERGIFVVNLLDLPGPNWADLNTHTNYNRHQIILQNDADETIYLPFAMDGGGRAAYYITGGSPLFRDTQDEPIGAPIQISKNWHDPPAWYHLYATLALAPGRHEIEHTFAHAKWGEAYAAAHAQLSLIGWGQNQQWDESSLGAFGESITYDPDLTLSRSMVDDVRPFLVQAQNQWSWTGNVGGASFLVYQGVLPTDRPDHQLGQLKTHYAYTGPNLTDVVYAGITRDQKISARISTQLGRTDDLVRAYYHLHYVFHEDVSYERLAFFQVASDRYADNGFRRYAYGNAQEVLFDDEVPNHATTGYPSSESRGIPIDGDAPWVMLYDSNHTTGNLPEHIANVGFVIRDYEARIGDSLITTPHININRTFNGGWSQMAFELGLPFSEENRFIPAGSEVRATVEYVIPPADKDLYYGESDYLLEMPAYDYQSTEMLRHLAAHNALEVETFVGSVVRTHPIELLASPGATAVRFILKGGRGYIPFTVHGLARPDGWRLERYDDETWTPVDQSVEGNDYWQAYHSAESGSFDLVFNLHNRGSHQYRLVQGEQACIGVLPGDARVCDDVNECENRNGGCAQTCINLEGSFECACDAGYVLNNDGLGCEDVNECAIDRGGCEQDCVNEVGSFSCACQTGYELHENGFQCVDIDECLKIDTHDCPANESCNNTQGTYVCGCEAPECVPEGCTDSRAPNYQPAALLDDGSCFLCSDAQTFGYRRTECSWDCDAAWGDCWMAKADEVCDFYFCKNRSVCEPDNESSPTFDAERETLSSLSSLTTAPAHYTTATGSETNLLSPGETKAIYFDALDYKGSATRVFAHIGIPSEASAATPVPGIVLVHGGGGTAFSAWVERWKERGYAAISIAVEGQNDETATQNDIDSGQSVGTWRKHEAAGPQRTGAYNDYAQSLEAQWMYHAVADTILAHSLLANLPEVNPEQIGLMGISWGGVIAATTMGLDSRIAFAIPVYGNGHKFDIPNYFGSALKNNELYREVWDPMQWIAASQAPTLWLTWLRENNFSLDSQAATYFRASGSRMVSIVPDMGHGHVAAWNRPESYDFADAVVQTGIPWCSQESVYEENNIAEATFSSTRPLTSATLYYTTDTGWTGEFAWDQKEVTSIEEVAPGRWTMAAIIPTNATAWLFVVRAAADAQSNTFGYSDTELVVSSDYKERISLSVTPEQGVVAGHPLAATESTSSAYLRFHAPSYVEVVDVSFRDESHPGAFCTPLNFPWSLEDPAPAQHMLPLEFHNDVAGLREGQQASAIVNIAWSKLDGSMEQSEISVEVTARSAFDVIFTEDGAWSSQRVYAADRVTIVNGAEIHLDLAQSAAELAVQQGTLRFDANETLALSERLQVDAAGQLLVPTGTLDSNASTYRIDGLLQVHGGRVQQNMAGVRRDLIGTGRIEIISGSFSFLNGQATDVLDVETDFRITGGLVELSGQVYVGFQTPTVFEIIGSEAQVSMVRLNAGPTINKGTFRFVLDATGVSPIVVPGWMNLAGASLEVDGSAYTGGPTQILLLDSTNLVGLISENKISISGFSAQGLVAHIEQDVDAGKDWVRLILEQP